MAAWRTAAAVARSIPKLQSHHVAPGRDPPGGIVVRCGFDDEVEAIQVSSKRADLLDALGQLIGVDQVDGEVAIPPSRTTDRCAPGPPSADPDRDARLLDGPRLEHDVARLVVAAVVVDGRPGPEALDQVE